MTLTFGDIEIPVGELSDVLRDAARGVSRSRDFEDRSDPQGWAVALGTEVKRTLGPEALALALQPMILSPEGADVRLAVAIQALTSVIGASAWWAALFGHLDAGRLASAEAVCGPLTVWAAKGPIEVPLRARTVLLDPSTPHRVERALAAVAVRHDRAWLLDHVEILCRHERPLVLLTAGVLNGHELGPFLIDFDHALATSGHRVPVQATAELQRMLRELLAAGT